MHRQVLALVLASQLAGCFTYALNVDDPSRETMGMFAGAEVAGGLGIGVAMKVSDHSLGSLGEDLLAAVIATLVVDLAIGLGVRTPDLVGQ